MSALCARATHLSRDDLASVGAIALITAVDSFDPSRGVPFGAYARRRITGAFADEMRSSDWAPRSVRRRIGDTLAAQDTLAASLGRTPTVDELAATLGISRQEVQGALDDASRSVHTLEDTVLELFTDRRSAAEQLPETRLLVDEQVRYLRAAVTHLPERMRHIIEQVFFEGRSITDVATGLGITHSAVSQQKSEAHRLLQDLMMGRGQESRPNATYSPWCPRRTVARQQSQDNDSDRTSNSQATSLEISKVSRLSGPASV